LAAGKRRRGREGRRVGKLKGSGKGEEGR